MFNAFTKIFAIGSNYIIDIFNEEVEVTEKIDGSQFAMMNDNGDVRTRSKGKEIFKESCEKMFQLAVDYANSIDLPEGLTFYCEYLNRPKHNTLAYNRVPKNNLALFGVRDRTDKFYEYDEIVKYAEMLNIEAIPLIFKGKINNAEEIFEMIKKESVLGGCEVEGVVVKNYERKFLLGGQPMPIMAGKYVSEKFKEVHQNGWKGEHTSKGKWQEFKESFRTEARWHKAVQHLKESGELENSPRDIGKLLKEVNKDITEEEKENIKDFLWKEFGKEVLRHATNGFPEWYKQLLAKESF